jgi:hypothetical protein
MTIAFPNNARSYDETAKRVRFMGYDGMFEIRFFVAADVLTAGHPQRAVSERDCLSAFDAMRTKILNVAQKVYSKTRKATVMLDSRDFD